MLYQPVHLEHACHLARERGRLQRLNDSEAGKHDRLVALLNLRCDNRDWGYGRWRRGGLTSGLEGDDSERRGAQREDSQSGFVGRVLADALAMKARRRKAEHGPARGPFLEPQT